MAADSEVEMAEARAVVEMGARWGGRGGGGRAAATVEVVAAVAMGAAGAVGAGRRRAAGDSGGGGGAGGEGGVCERVRPRSVSKPQPLFSMFGLELRQRAQPPTVRRTLAGAACMVTSFPKLLSALVIANTFTLFEEMMRASPQTAAAHAFIAT